MRVRRGYTLIDLVAVVVVVAVGGVMFAHATAPVKRQAMGLASMRNLSLIGQMSAVYQNENAGFLPSYSWQPGGEYQITVEDGAAGTVPYTPATYLNAHQWQHIDLLRRLTRRITGPDIMNSTSSS